MIEELVVVIKLDPVLVLVGCMQFLLPLAGFVTVIPPIPLQIISEADDEGLIKELEGTDNDDWVRVVLLVCSDGLALSLEDLGDWDDPEVVLRTFVDGLEGILEDGILLAIVELGALEESWEVADREIGAVEDDATGAEELDEPEVDNALLGKLDTLAGKLEEVKIVDDGWFSPLDEL